MDAIRLTNLVKKYGLEGSEPLEREVQILNPPAAEAVAHETLWDDEDPTLPLRSRKRVVDEEGEEEPEARPEHGAEGK